jgi:hypothetical protein
MTRTKILSRRSFGRLLAATTLIPEALPQTLTRDEELRAAQQRRVATAEALTKFQVPMATEPASTFRP